MGHAVSELYLARRWVIGGSGYMIGHGGRMRPKELLHCLLLRALPTCLFLQCPALPLRALLLTCLRALSCLALPCLALPCLASVASFVSLSFSTIVRSQKVPRRENEALQRILARISNDGRGGVVVTWQMTLRLVII